LLVTQQFKNGDKVVTKVVCCWEKGAILAPVAAGQQSSCITFALKQGGSATCAWAAALLFAADRRNL